MSKKKTSEINATPPTPAGKAEKGKKSATKVPASGDSKLAAPAAAPKAAATKTASLAPTPSPKKKTSKSATASAPSVETVPSPATPKTKSKTANNGNSGLAASVPEISHDEIAKLAYSYAEARGFQGGSPESDWLRAEEEIRRIRGL